MKTLSNKLCKNSCTYTKVSDGKRSFLYEQRGTGDRIIGYEVFLKRIKPEREVFGKTLPETVVFPNSEAFGKWAWSFYSYSKALIKFNLLESKID